MALHHALILLGPPGAGKGTQAKLLAKRCGVPHLSTGDIFRDAVSRGSEIGQLVKPYLDRGELVPDHIVMKTIDDRLSRSDCSSGAVFDGFPRTVSQARDFDALLNRSGFGKPIVIDIRVNREDLMRRLTGRWTCSIGGEIYNIFDAPPKKHGICDADGGKLLQRSDDRPEVVKQRLATYDEKTKPLTDYYLRLGVLETVDGTGTMEQVSKALTAVVERAKSRDGYL
jgi:adenylate kinase